MSISNETLWQALPIPSASAGKPDFVHIPPPAPPPRNRWRQALRSTRELVSQSDAADKAIEVFYALSIGEFEGWFQRFLVDPHGRALMATRPQLGDVLCDRRVLAAMPSGSFGQAYMEFVVRNDLDPEGVLEANAKAQRAVGSLELDPVRSWFRNRLVLSHDLGHVLTGYETDGAGETRLLAFSLAQYGGRAYKLLTLAAGLDSWRGQGSAWPRELARAWSLGRRARWLAALPLEDLLAQPLGDARRTARLY